MHLLATASFLLGLAHAGSPSSAGLPCARQPLPPAIDALPDPTNISDIISFSATPSLQYPGRAWVVRLYRQAPAATLEIVLLRRQSNCNRYAIEQRWQASIHPQEYRTVAEAVKPWTVPPWARASNDRGSTKGLVVDGTLIELRRTSSGWQLTRRLNQFDQRGTELSAIFRHLLLKHVPASELPTEDWRTDRGD